MNNVFLVYCSCNKFDKVSHAIQIGPNCKVNLTINMDVKLGLTNKTTGIVRKIVKSIDPKDPPIILVYFEGYKGIDCKNGALESPRGMGSM